MVPPDPPPGGPPSRSLGWWSISGEALLAMLRRVHDGEDPDMVYAEEYANAERDQTSD